MTLGDSRVGIDFNPSGSKTIADLKRRAADFIDAVDAIELLGEAPGEIARLKALAMTEIESAAMWAVKAAARSGAASRLPGVAARIATTLRSFCEAVGWPRLRRLSDAIARVRESERRAAAAPKPAPAPGPHRRPARRDSPRCHMATRNRRQRRQISAGRERRRLALRHERRPPPSDHVGVDRGQVRPEHEGELRDPPLRHRDRRS